MINFYCMSRFLHNLFSSVTAKLRNHIKNFSGCKHEYHYARITELWLEMTEDPEKNLHESKLSVTFI